MIDHQQITPPKASNNKGQTESDFRIKRFIELMIPIHACTLRCPYCYVTHRGLFDTDIPQFQYSPQHIRKALSVKRLGGRSLINLCATGETLLSHEVVEIAKELLEEGHYLMIVTNATLSNRIDELAAFPPELLDRLFIKFSYHYEQLKRRNLLDKFFANIKKMRDAGASFTLEVTPYDELTPLVDELNERAYNELGAIPHYTVARDDRHKGRLPLLTAMSRRKYNTVWGRFNSPLFNFKFSIFEKPRKEFCYAGEWTGVVEITNGTWRQCYHSASKAVDIFTDLEKPIPFQAIGHNCMSHHCWNGHVWLGLGCIPTLKTPTYAEMRDKVCNDGSHWLSPTFRKVFSHKLYDCNCEYSRAKKAATAIKVTPYAMLRKLKNKIQNNISD